MIECPATCSLGAYSGSVLTKRRNRIARELSANLVDPLELSRISPEVILDWPAARAVQ
jgi:hypothetical protein